MGNGLVAGALALLIAAAPAEAAVIDELLSLHDGNARVRVAAIADDVIRVTVIQDGGAAPPASWVITGELRERDVGHLVSAADDVLTLTTGKLSVELDLARGSLRVSTLDGQTVSADVVDRPLEWHGPEFTLRKALDPREHLYGLGDKTGALDRRGRSFVNWNTDAYGFSSDTDPIYKSIPFLVSVGGAGGAYGLFLDNTWRSAFDLGQRDPGTLALGADGGPIDYYLIYGPTLKRVVARYADLTGHAPLPPLWSLGFQQSKYSFMSAAEVLAEARRLRADRIPADALWLDIDFLDRTRPFTVNRTTYPDLADLVRRLAADHLKLIAISDLHIARAPGEGYAPFDSGAAGDHFLHRADGSTYVAPVWPGDSVFPEFTRPSTREWWGTLFRPLVEAGVAGAWNDMNEPAIFETPTKTMAPDVVHRVEGDGGEARIAPHAEIHNVYGMQNARATFEGLSRLRPDERPYVMTRAMFAGAQRYAVTWTGDNRSSWEHLRLSVAQILNLGLSGVPYVGADIGGFAGSPSAELLTRWIQIGAFLPSFRDHYGKGHAPHEPWADGIAQLDIRRRFIEERYRLLPYWYALADENVRTGAPLVRPLFYEFEDAQSGGCDQTLPFLVGAGLLVVLPADLESPAPYDVCLPAGGWYDYWSGRAIGDPAAADPALTPQRFAVTPAPDSLPIFVRAGTILPRQPVVQSTAEVPDGPLTVDVYPGDECRGELYLDDGHSLGYRRGEFLRQGVTCSVEAGGVTVEFAPREGRFRPWWKGVRVVVHAAVGLRPDGGAGHGSPSLEPRREAIVDVADPVGGARLHFVRDPVAGIAARR